MIQTEQVAKRIHEKHPLVEIVECENSLDPADKMISSMRIIWKLSTGQIVSQTLNREDFDRIFDTAADQVKQMSNREVRKSGKGIRVLRRERAFDVFADECVAFLDDAEHKVIA